MCEIIEICGQVRDEDRAWLNTACQRLRHRGPDAGGCWMAPEGNAVLGDSRLSIIDTSHGSDQPFVSEDGKLVMVFNGEIYNYPEIRALTCSNEASNFAHRSVLVSNVKIG